MHKAAAKGHSEIALLILHSGGNSNAKDKYGNTPLHAAIRNGKSVIESIDGEGQRSVALQLIAQGTDPYVKNNKGETPLDKAKSQDFRHFIERKNIEIFFESR